jgi:hypothetical protein
MKRAQLRKKFGRSFHPAIQRRNIHIQQDKEAPRKSNMRVSLTFVLKHQRVENIGFALNSEVETAEPESSLTRLVNFISPKILFIITSQNMMSVLTIKFVMNDLEERQL